MCLRRRALLKQVIEEGFEDAAKKKRPRNVEVVRPGRLLTCVSGLQRELAKAGNPEQQEMVKRLEQIRLATLQELQDVAYVPDASS